MVIVAAYGVDLRAPEKPDSPAVDQHKTLPESSVTLANVELNVAVTYRQPLGTTRTFDLTLVGADFAAGVGVAIIKFLTQSYLAGVSTFAAISLVIEPTVRRRWPPRALRELDRVR